ncbi:DUF3048 domain-containing protein [Pseudactinotalea sp.]|uniref:DUF3048 domain-containing protein n=1 Tax=Pseudactinotalea sp. TaxID=1926260 RepID=UPI003B3BD7CA
MSVTRMRVAAAAVAAVALLAGCAASGSGKVMILQVTERETVEADKGEVPEPDMPLVWPLTGVPTSEVADRPAMSVKIENSAAARPQTGLGEADVVWEEMVEGGITRFNAVYHSQIPSELGPIRSLRPMDAAISGPFGGLFVFSGGQARFVNQVASTGLTMLSHDGGDAGFYRTSDRVAPHNVYGDPETFLAAGEGQDPPPTQFEFALDAEGATALDGEATSSIAIAFPSSSPGWSWDGDAWERTEGGQPAMTADSGQITSVNVVVLRVQVRNSGAVDPGGNPVPETILTGSGEATVFSGGHRIDATWSKSEVGSVLVLSTADDEPVHLAPGNVWVELVPVSGGSVSAS